MCTLKQVAHFYNTLDQQMISCQQPMMLNSAIAFEKLVKNPKTGNLKFFPLVELNEQHFYTYIYM